jgi:uncharacterized protein (TIGR02453 family)
VTRFTGFPPAAFEFYDQLSVNNSKAWWTAHKDTYDSAVHQPFVALLAELEDEFGEGKVFRPYRDVRFSREKTPYKDHQGAFVGAEDGMGWYVQISATGLMIAGGWYSSASQQVARYRDAVDSAVVVELERAIATAEKGGLELGGDVMKTRPRGVDADHPHVDLLRHRTLTVEKHCGQPAWVGTRKALTQVRATWQAMTPLVEWLVDHVGPIDDGIPAEPR